MKINIQYNKYLDPIFIDYIHSQEKWASYPVPKEEDVLNKTELFKDVWGKWGEKIIGAMQDITGILFIRNTIDVHIVSLNPRSYSNPIIIKSGLTQEEFVNVLTHELIHILFGEDESKWKSIFKHAKWKYPDENDSTIVHFIVYSIMDSIYKKIGSDFIRNVDLKTSLANVDYDRARTMSEADKDYILDAFKK